MQSVKPCVFPERKRPFKPTTVSMKDLGVIVSKDLSWSRHIESIVSQANKISGLIKRICKDVKNVQTRRTLHCALVRSKLEYASNVWSPCTIKHKLLIENVKRRATRFILNYPKDMCYKERLQKIDLLPLELRREISDQILLFKAKYISDKVIKSSDNLASFRTRVINLYNNKLITYTNFLVLAINK